VPLPLELEAGTSLPGDALGRVFVAGSPVGIRAPSPSTTQSVDDEVVAGQQVGAMSLWW
jgi:hypothetical protein